MAAVRCPLRADFIPITQPAPAYISGTTLVDFTDPDTTLLGAVSAGKQMLVYNNDLEELTVPASWAAWGKPPDVETATPRVGFTSGNSSLVIGLSLPVRTFGLEVEPDNGAREQTTAAFYDGPNLVGTIDLFPDGNGGALLFAASTTTSPFTSVVITNLTGDDFAIARQRFALVQTPEPATFSLLGLSALGAALAYGAQRKAKAKRVLPGPM